MFSGSGAHADNKVEARKGCSPGTGRHDLDVFEFLASYFHAVDDSSRHDDGCAMLIVMKHRNVHALLEFGFNDKALRRLDILQIDTAKGRLQHCNSVYRKYPGPWHQARGRTRQCQRIS